MPQFKMIRLKTSQLSDAQWQSFGSLLNEAFPKDGLSDLQCTDKARKSFGDGQDIILVHGDNPDEIIASAVSFAREISTSCGKFQILALAAVAVRKVMRGKDLGAQVVRECFRRVDDGEFPVCFFQTGVEGFYQKLGCRRIENRVVNSLAEDKEANPFWDDCLMIYPAGYNWPEGVIDLLGAGY